MLTNEQVDKVIANL